MEERAGERRGPLSTASLLALPKRTTLFPTLSSTLRSTTPSPGRPNCDCYGGRALLRRERGRKQRWQCRDAPMKKRKPRDVCEMLVLRIFGLRQNVKRCHSVKGFVSILVMLDFHHP